MRKVWVIGIIILFTLSALAPITFGTTVKSIDEKEIQPVFSSYNDLIDSAKPMFQHDIRNSNRNSDSKAIIWDNGGPTDDWVLILSQLDEVFPFNSQVADDFIFKYEDTEILGVRWWGNFWGVGDPFDPVDFNIYFYADDGTDNAPTGAGMEHPEDTALESYYIQGVSGINDSGHRFYSVDLPTPFIAYQGEKYWLVVQAIFEILPKWGRVTNDGTIHLASSVFGCPILGEPFWTNLGYGDMAWYLTGGINEPPNAPIITGPVNGKTGEEYQYNFSISDPDADSMHIRIDWGNGIPGKWDGPFPSGSIIKYNYTWKKKGTYTIRAQTMDTYGAMSPWGELTVTMPRYKIISNSLLQWILERFPLSERLLNLFFAQ